jgi:hypothetical protein
VLTRLVSFLIVLPLAGLAACAVDDPPPAAACDAPRYYLIDRVDLPDRPGDGAAVGLDLDGDGRHDNAYAALVDFVSHSNDDLRDLDARVGDRFARHDVLWLIGVRECDGGEREVELRHGVLAGRRDATGASAAIQLVGDAMPFPARRDPAGSVVADGGEGDVPLTALVDPVGTFAPMAWRTAGRAAVRLSIDGDALTGTVAFAVHVPAATHDLVAPFAAYLSGELAVGVSPFAARLDGDHDGVCTADELLASDIGRSLTAPDVSIDRAYDGFSFGIAVHATHVAVAPM